MTDRPSNTIALDSGYTLETLTMELRFLNGTLQQKVRIETFSYDLTNGTSFEWRDVTIVEESK